ncbi:toll/interleukin-1 receptor domain-containing protein [Ferrovibrio xuzhouensis]|uniref:Toll/interleukin-1 receptor domain-containing protein n=2 Tax=Ferrovibrio xuzhouensis TaxID=1576914 RepID=A0ABV7VJS9_9PROT
MVSQSVPILPVVDDLEHATGQLPPSIQPLNALGLKQNPLERIASALLECVSLLPRQRRVFLSYRRIESRSAALQLFDTLSARQFNVFLDTHEISPGVHFQQALWHNLCDCDVLVMLDTADYFGSRWTKAEFGRALAKGIPILRVGWPSVATARIAQTSSSIALDGIDLDAGGNISLTKVTEICNAVERLRCLSHAVRNLNIVSHLKKAAECVGGQLKAVGRNSAVHIELPSGGGEIIVYPQVGVPTSRSLQEAHGYAISRTTLVPAVVYDHLGLDPAWQGHLDWLGDQVQAVRWLKLERAAWSFADWEDKT